MVHPASRKKGVGLALLAEMERFAADHGGRRIEGEVQDADTASLAYVEKRGYAVERHGYDAILDLSSFDESPFAGAVTAAQGRGIRFFTLADADTPATRWPLYELYGRTMVDIPPMLAVNRKLGYKPLAGDYTVVRRMGAP